MEHPIIEAVFNVGLSTPSKQLEQARQLVFTSTDDPVLFFLLPPADLLNRTVPLETLLLDDFLLAHVAVLTENKELKCLDANSTLYEFIGRSIARKSTNPHPVDVVSAFTWQPGIGPANFNSAYTVLHIANLLVQPQTVKPASWFNKRRSLPLNGMTAVPRPSSPVKPDVTEQKCEQKSESSVDLAVSSVESSETAYIAACMQMDAESPRELMHRFRKTVRAVAKVIKAKPGFSSADSAGIALQYVESKLAVPVLAKLTQLIKPELPLADIQESARYLDLCQVDIPLLTLRQTPQFDSAVDAAAQTLKILAVSTDSTKIDSVLAASLALLTADSLKTVSADALIGLLMLALVRTSKEAAIALEPRLFYLLYCSTPDGKTEYMLMLLTSVLCQLRIEVSRLNFFSQSNRAVWTAISACDWDSLHAINTKCPTSFLARENGDSALVLAMKTSVLALEYLFTNFAQIYTFDFVVADRDARKRTLLMHALKNTSSTQLVLNILLANTENRRTDVETYINAADSDGDTVAHYLALASDVDVAFKALDPILKYVDWTVKNNSGNSPLILLVKRGNTHGLQFMADFYAHITSSGDSLLHIAAKNADYRAVSEILALPSTNIDFANYEAQTPLAFTFSNPEIASLLVSNGANPWIDVGSPVPLPVRNSRVRTGFYAESPDFKSINLFVNSTNAYPDLDLSSISLELAKIPQFNEYLGKTFSYSWTPTSLAAEIMSVSTSPLLLPSKEAANTNIDINRPTAEPVLLELKTLVSEDLSTRVMFYFRAVNAHATYAHAITPFILQKTLPPPTTASSSNESVQSVLAFSQISQEQLRSMQPALNAVCRQFCQLHTAVSSVDTAFTTLHRQIRHLNPSYDAENVLQQPCPRVLIWRAIALDLSMLSMCISDVCTEFLKPAALIAKLNETQRLVAEFKRRHLIMHANRHSWLPSLEEKRAAEIAQIEVDTQNLEQQAKNLELESRRSHFYLAAELSAFYTFTEHEIVEKTRAFADYSICVEKRRLNTLNALLSTLKSSNDSQ